MHKLNGLHVQVDGLFISDPKAIHYIFQTSGYNFERVPERRARSRLISGQGLVWADGTSNRFHDTWMSTILT